MESYPVYAASGEYQPTPNVHEVINKLTSGRPPALAANSLMRNCFAAAFPLFGVQLYNGKSEMIDRLDLRISGKRTVLTHANFPSPGIPMGQLAARISRTYDGSVSQSISCPTDWSSNLLKLGLQL